MSQDPRLSDPPPRPPGTDGLGGCLTVLQVVVGIVLTLPGLCSLIFMMGPGSGDLPGLRALWMMTFVVAAAGIALIAWATIRHR